MPPPDAPIGPAVTATEVGRASAQGSNMTVSMPYIPPTVYLLADNLDAALAAGEDLLRSCLVWQIGEATEGAQIARARAEQRAKLSAIRTLEQVLLARVLKSRERAEEIGKHDKRFSTVARLYNGGTAILIEAVSEFGDGAAQDFETGDGMVAYLRSRGMLAKDAEGPKEAQLLAVTEDFLIARRIRLGTLLDLIAMFLDALEVHFDLFADDPAVPDVLPGEVPLVEEADPTTRDRPG